MSYIYDEDLKYISTSRGFNIVVESEKATQIYLDENVQGPMISTSHILPAIKKVFFLKTDLQRFEGLPQEKLSDNDLKLQCAQDIQEAYQKVGTI